MLVKFLRGVRRLTIFSKKKDDNTSFSDIDEYINSSDNLSYLIKNIKKQNANKELILPPQSERDKGKLTVVMEMDEVLSYTFSPDEEGYLLAPIRKYDFYREYEEYDAYLSIYKRKNLDNFINYVAEECQPVIFSTGVQSYVDLVMDALDPGRKIQHRLSQKSCDHIEHEKEGLDEFIKDFDLLGRDMSRVVYIDCKPLSFWLHPDNCLPLQEFRADNTMETEDMNWIILELQKLRKQKDVREYLKQRYAIRQLLQESKLL